MILANLKGKRGGYFNLNLRAQRRLPAIVGYYQSPKQSPFLKPRACQEELIDPAHQELELDYSWGGWIEDRSTVWRGCYMQAGNKYIHLGYDFNAPVGTLVAVDMHCKVISIYSDTPEEHGWGTRVIVRLLDEPMYLIYARVDLLSPAEKLLGTKLKPGDVFGTIAPPERNGGWYSHLHLQGMSPEGYELFKAVPESLDGYGKIGEEAKLARLYPDPMRYIRIE